MRGGAVIAWATLSAGMCVAGCALSHRLDAPAEGDAIADAAVESPDASVSSDADAPGDFGVDTISLCAPAGGYPTSVRVEAVEPAGCVGDEPSTTTIPFPFDEFFMPEALTRVAPCEWSVHAEPTWTMPGFASSVRGVMGMGPDGVYGRLELLLISDPGATCEYVIVFGDGAR